MNNLKGYSQDTLFSNICKTKILFAFNWFRTEIFILSLKKMKKSLILKVLFITTYRIIFRKTKTVLKFM